MKKKCLWCEERTVSLFGVYDEDSNICSVCLDILNKKSNEPVQGQASRERSYYSDDIVQPIKKDGNINKKFVQAHGTKGIEKSLKISKEKIIENIEKYG